MTIRAILTGTVQLDSIQKGVVDGQSRALLMFRLETENQVISIFAKGLPALAMARYAEVVEKTVTKELTVTVEIDLVAIGHWVLPFAAKIYWYVFGDLRDQAEELIRKDKRTTNDGLGIPPSWPHRTLFG